ncbi:bile acid:sodium symporter [Methanoplanus sp. FWC-SCC4]|uniref:Bile acid:sodium symporter n=1 Tax=Methanochimaera problematica TaxID=2609417 RepID=A0AA97F9Z7_9EURY|nr:bile acid:sodium symporter [Methanoplanus sp. FWC-SCC4]WOF15535.1 bile acid:sodium symporter [Methanoplanus sp. FWC-SCC4]
MSSMFSIGLGISFKKIVDIFRDPELLTKSLLINLILIPAIAVMLALLLGIKGSLFLGFMMMACAPGASYAPRITEIANGDVEHSIILMFVLCSFALFSAPLTLPLFISSPAIVNLWDVIRILAIVQVFPLISGIYLNSQKPKISRRISHIVFKFSNISAFIAIMASLVIIFFSEAGMMLYSVITDLKSIIGMILVVFFSLLLGYMSGGDNIGRKKSMATGSANRNAGVAFLIASSSFVLLPDVIIIIIAYIIIQTLMSGSLAGYWLWKDMKSGKSTILSVNR